MQAVADEASTPRRKLRQASLPSYNPPAGLSVQVLFVFQPPHALSRHCLLLRKPMACSRACFCVPASSAATGGATEHCQRLRTVMDSNQHRQLVILSISTPRVARRLHFETLLGDRGSHADLARRMPQVFKPYNSPYTLPIPASAKPSAMTTAPNLNYTAASSGGVMALAGGTMTNFALRFTGKHIPQLAGPCPLVNCLSVSDICHHAVSLFTTRSPGLRGHLPAENTCCLCSTTSENSSPKVATIECSQGTATSPSLTVDLHQRRVPQHTRLQAGKLHIPAGQRRRLPAVHRRQCGHLRPRCCSGCCSAYRF